MNIVAKFFLSLLTLLALSGCDGDGAIFIAAPEGQIVVEPNTAVVAAGTTQQYTATLVTLVTGEPDKQDVTATVDWVSTDTAVATIDSNGLVTARSSGETDIIATQGFYRGRAKLTVTANAIVEITVEPASSTLLLGLVKQYTAIARFSDNTTQDITYDSTWTSSDTAVSVISTTGLATAVAVGNATISATYNGVTGNSDLNVINTLVRNFVVTPFNTSLHAGGQKQLQAYLVLVDGTSIDVTNAVNWQSSDSAVASVGDVSIRSLRRQNPKGLVTAIAQGSAVITASAVLPSGPISATANVTVTAPLITSLQVVPSQVSVPKGTIGTLRAIAYYTDNSVEDVTREAGWLSDNHGVVFVVTTGDFAGDAIATGVGLATVTASFSGLTATSDITVLGPVITSIQVSPEDLSIPLGSSGNYIATAIYSDFTSAEITQLATWFASDPGIIDLVPGGENAGFVNTLALGSSIVTASYQGVDGSTSIEVTAATLDALQIEPANISVPAGTTGQYTATAYYSDGTFENVTTQTTWLSSDQSVFDIVTSDSDGGKYAAYIAGGPVTVTADFKGATATTTATVTAAVIESITVTPVNGSLPLGSIYHYQATAIYSDNTSADITDEANWLSSVPAVAQIIATGIDAGKVTTLSEGGTTISASLDGQSGSTGLTVTPAVLSALQITPADVSMPAGTSGAYTATAYYSDNSTEDVTDQATWLSSNTAVATIIPRGIDAGYATSKIAGGTDISASFGGITSSTPLTVTAAVLLSIEVSPVNANVPLGIDVQYQAIGIYSDNSNSDLTDSATWQSSNQDVATINDEGTAVTLSLGVSTISAKLNTGGTSFVSGSTTLTVSNAVITQLVITPNGGSVPLGIGGKLTATAHYSDDSSQDVTQLATWASSDTSVASVVTSGVNGGLVQTLSEGPVTITAGFDGQASSANFIVTSAVLTSILVDPASKSVAKGLDIQYTATGIYTDGSSADLTTNVNWQSSVPSVATIEADGNAQSILEGSTQISASLDAIIGTAELTVTAATIVSINIVPESITVPAGVDGQLTAIAIYSDNDTQDVTSRCTWLSDMPTIVSVIAGGENAGFTTALAPGGPVTVTARLVDADGTVFNSSTFVTVTAATLVTIQVNPPNETIASGIDVQYDAIGIYTDGNTSDITNEVVWLSDDPVLVSIDQSGFASTSEILTGIANISATHDSVTGSTPLNVIAITAERLEITPQFSSIAQDTTEQFVATAILNNGTSYPVTDLVVWSSSDATVATISNDVLTKGLATATGVGLTQIKASILYLGDLFEDTANLVVIPRVLDHIIVSAEETTIFENTTTQFFAQGVYVDGSTDDLTEAVTWTTSDSNIAVVSNITGDKGNTIGVSAGTANITATFVDAADRTITDSESIEVVPLLDIAGLTITPGDSLIPIGGGLQYTATATLIDGDSIIVTDQVVWNSTDTGVVAISSSGLATSVTPSTVTISAALGGFTDNVLLSVTDSTDVVVLISPLGPRIALGTEQQFEAQITIGGVPIEGATEAVIWNTDDSDIATISNANKKEGLATSRNFGLVTISFDYVSAVDGAIYTASTLMEVVDISGATFTLDINPKNDTINVNDRSQYTLTGNWDIGGGDIIVQDITNSQGTSWDTGDGSIASIKTNSGQGQKGEVKGESVGTTTVTGEFAGDAVTTDITVNP